MAEPAKPATLKDILNYAPEAYLNDEELQWIRATFKGDTVGIALLRKLFLPSALDPELPIEEMKSDVWMIDTDFRQLPESEVKSTAIARQDTIKFILGGLVKLKVLANTPDETPMEAALRRSKDDTK